MAAEDAPVSIEFAPGTTVFRELDLISHLPILRNGPPGTFVVFTSGLRVSLPTDQIVGVDEAGGRARVGFGGMRFHGIANGRLEFVRVRELRPENELSPDRSHIMTLESSWVSAVHVDGRLAWPAVAPAPSS
jgi:hypothetical protein